MAASRFGAIFLLPAIGVFVKMEENVSSPKYQSVLAQNLHSTAEGKKKKKGQERSSRTADLYERHMKLCQVCADWGVSTFDM